MAGMCMCVAAWCLSGEVLPVVLLGRSSGNEAGWWGAG
jgi:hypothetical protein